MADTREQVEVVVLLDDERDYYVIPRTALERARVPAARRHLVERALGALEADTSGYRLEAAAAGGRAPARLAPVGVLTLSVAALAGLGLARSPAETVPIAGHTGRSEPMDAATSNPTTASGAEEALVLRHTTGEYYAIPRAALEIWRVPPGQIPELEEALAEDTTGF
jgi:hypothetical protein